MRVQAGRGDRVLQPVGDHYRVDRVEEAHHQLQIGLRVHQVRQWRRRSHLTCTSWPTLSARTARGSYSQPAKLAAGLNSRTPGLGRLRQRLGKSVFDRSAPRLMPGTNGAWLLPTGADALPSAPAHLYVMRSVRLSVTEFACNGTFRAFGRGPLSICQSATEVARSVAAEMPSTATTTVIPR